MPKFMKPKKEKAPKTKEKKPKAVKTKVKKDKPPKAPKAEKKNLLPKDKKLLILLAAVLMVIIIGAAIAIFLLTLGKKGKETQVEEGPKAPAYYFSKEEEVSSITEIVGERDFEDLTVVLPEEQTSKEESQEEASSESTAEETEPQKEIYQYLHVSDTAGDVQAYRNYLEEEKNFLDVTDRSEKPEEESSEAPEEEQEFCQLVGPSKDADSYLSITLEIRADNYTITAVKENEPWNTYLKAIWNQQKQKIEDFQKKPQTTNTIEQAEEAVRAQSQEKLGLPEPVDSYEYIATPGIVRIEGINYYAVRTYKQLEDRTLTYVGTFLFNCDTSDVSYQYDEITGQTTPLN